MGLLSKLLKNIVSEAVQNSISENVSVSAPEQEPELSFTEQDEDVFRMPESPMNPVELQARIRAVIAENYPDCEIQCDVSAQNFDSACHEKAKPVSLLIRKAGHPVLAIAVVTFNNYRSMPVVGTKRAVEALGITYIRFFCEYENRTDYICDRLAEYLK